MNAADYLTKEYKRSRIGYISQCAFAYFITLMSANAFLVKLLIHLELSDATIGIISSLGSFAVLFQLLTIAMMSRLRNTKRTVMIFNVTGHILAAVMYLIPFLPLPLLTRQILVVLCFGLSALSNNLASTLLFKWGTGFADPHKRGDFNAIKEIVSLIGGMVLSLLMGWLMDRYEAAGNLEGVFLLFAVVMLVFNVCNFCSMMVMAEDPTNKTVRKRHNFRDVIKNTLGNRSYVNLLFASILWQVAACMTVGFLGTYKTRELGLSVGAIQLIGIGGNLVQMFLSRPMGRYSDRTSYVRGYSVAMIPAVIAYVVNAFTTPDRWWLIIVYTLLCGVANAGIGQNSTMMVYSFVKDEYIVQALAMKSCIVGVIGFGASLVAGKILSSIQEAGNVFLGIPMYGQQLLSVITAVLALGVVIFSSTVLQKQKPIEN